MQNYKLKRGEDADEPFHLCFIGVRNISRLFCGVFTLTVAGIKIVLCSVKKVLCRFCLQNEQTLWHLVLKFQFVVVFKIILYPFKKITVKNHCIDWYFIS